MQEKEIDIDSLKEELVALRSKYKVEQEKLEWAEDDMEEFFIQEVMDKYVVSIKEINSEIKSLENIA